MLILDEGHYGELKDALGAGLPAIFAVLGISLLLGILAAIPPSALPVLLSDFLAPRRRHVAFAAASVCLSGAIGLGIVFWVL
jgi:hypothetical protein